MSIKNKLLNVFIQGIFSGMLSNVIFLIVLLFFYRLSKNNIKEIQNKINEFNVIKNDLKETIKIVKDIPDDIDSIKSKIDTVDSIKSKMDKIDNETNQILLDLKEIKKNTK